MPIVPPTTPAEQADLEQAVADMLAGRQAPPRWIGAREMLGSLHRMLQPLGAADSATDEGSGATSS
jgi:hypothetical protein